MYKYFKRASDIVISLILLILCGIPMLIIAIAIKLESKGPALFKQTRTGKGGEEFTLYKFRSMVKENNVYDFKTEDKMTHVGRVLRKSRLDELPQIFNILKGDMSLIGPRPWVVKYAENFTNYQKRRLEVRPGITGYAQASGRNNLSIFEKIEYDIEYVEHYSLMEDLKVIGMTMKTVLSKEGADLSKAGVHEEIVALREHCLFSTKDMTGDFEEASYEHDKNSVIA